MPWEREPESRDEQQPTMHQRRQDHRYAAGWFLVGVLVGSLLGGLGALVGSQRLARILQPPQIQLTIRPTQQEHLASPSAPMPPTVSSTVYPDTLPTMARSIIRSNLTGRIVFSCCIVGGIYVMNADGSGRTLLAAGDDPVWSPDSTRIAFHTERQGNVDIYVMNADGSGQNNLTNHPARDWGAAWAPDGQQIAFVSERTGDADIYTMNAEGSHPTNLTNRAGSDEYPSWSPTGTKIAFSSNRDGYRALYVMNADGSGQQLLTSGPNDTHPAWSPDSSQIVFQREGRDGVYLFVINADGTKERQLTEQVGENADWAPDGTKIIFNSLYSGLWVVNRDGSGLTELTSQPDAFPSWAR